MVKLIILRLPKNFILAESLAAIPKFSQFRYEQIENFDLLDFNPDIDGIVVKEM